MALSILAFAHSTRIQAAEDDPSTPAFEWQTVTPETVGLSTPRLNGLRDQLATHNTKGFLLIRDDKIVYEWYASDNSATKKYGAASMSKALIGGVSVAVTLTDGLLSLDDPATKFIPQWRADPLKSRITIRQLGSHTSGLDDAEDAGKPHDDLTGWKGDFWKRLPPPRDSFTLARDAAPMRFAPGEARLYSNLGIAMLNYATTAALKDAPHHDIRSLLRDRVMRPIGVRDDEWTAGYGETVTVDGLSLVASWGGGSFTARTAARIARLMMREGEWEGRRLLKAEAVRAVTTDPACPPNPAQKWLSKQTGSVAIGWWRNTDGVVPNLPRDAYWGAGAGHQITLVVPSWRVLAVRNGQTLRPGDYDAARNVLFFQPLLEALALRADAQAQISSVEAPPFWAYAVNPPDFKAPADDGSLRHVPGSERTFTLTEVRNSFLSPDWHPEDHPPLPEVVAHGRKPNVLACGYCHRAEGTGGPENTSLAGLPAGYIIQQMADFKSGVRNSSVPGRAPVTNMIASAKAATPAEVEAAAAYFSSLKTKPIIRVIETNMVPKHRVFGWHMLPIEDSEKEPIGQRVLESPENLEQFVSRDSRVHFIAYVPEGSIEKGRALAATGGAGRTVQCAICHGPDLKGLGPIPPIAGRSPSYLIRQLYDFKHGTRAGLSSALMKPTVEHLTLEEMIALAAYAASLSP